MPIMGILKVFNFIIFHKNLFFYQGIKKFEWYSPLYDVYTPHYIVAKNRFFGEKSVFLTILKISFFSKKIHFHRISTWSTDRSFCPIFTLYSSFCRKLSELCISLIFANFFRESSRKKRFLRKSFFREKIAKLVKFRRIQGVSEVSHPSKFVPNLFF